MEKHVSTRELKASLGEIVDSVRLRGDRYVIERRGKPVAVLVPVDVHESLRRSRHRLADLMDEVSGRNRDTDPADLEAAIEEAVTQARSGD